MTDSPPDARTPGQPSVGESRQPRTRRDAWIMAGLVYAGVTLYVLLGALVFVGGVAAAVAGGYLAFYALLLVPWLSVVLRVWQRAPRRGVRLRQHMAQGFAALGLLLVNWALLTAVLLALIPIAVTFLPAGPVATALDTFWFGLHQLPAGVVSAGPFGPVTTAVGLALAGATAGLASYGLRLRQVIARRLGAS